MKLLLGCVLIGAVVCLFVAHAIGAVRLNRAIRAGEDADRLTWVLFGGGMVGVGICYAISVVLAALAR